ncbi:MAG: hypothetical protein ACXVNF_00840 [Neobacillus sp.]
MVNTLRLKLKEPKGFTLIKLLALGNYSYDLGGVHLSIPLNLSSISEQDLITAVQ